MESEPMLTPREKSPLPEAQRKIKRMTLHHSGQQAQGTTDWAILVLEQNQTMGYYEMNGSGYPSLIWQWRHLPWEWEPHGAIQAMAASRPDKP